MDTEEITWRRIRNKITKSLTCGPGSDLPKGPNLFSNTRLNYWRKFSWKWRRIWNRMPVISFIISGVNSFPLWNYLHLFYYLTRRCYVYFLLLIPISFQLFKNKKKEIEKSWYRKIPRNKNIWIHCWHIQKMKRERQASNNHTKIKIRNQEFVWNQKIRYPELPTGK